MSENSNSFEDNPVMVLTFGSMLAAGVLSAAGAWLVAKWQVAVAWMIEHQVLVSADQAIVPLGDGGLDLARVVVLVAAILAVVLLLVMAVRAVRVRRRRKAMLREFGR